jgi:hypothetical protein
MPTKSYLSFAGFVMLIAATYCPILRPFGLRNLDLYQVNQPYGLLLLLIGVIGILGIVLRQKAITRLCAWFALVLVIVLYVAAIFRIHQFFGFIPFKSVSGFFVRQIKFKWGWFALFGGPILAIIGVFTTKRSAVIPINKEK